jgi:hypothetical protein
LGRAGGALRVRRRAHALELLHPVKPIGVIDPMAMATATAHSDNPTW